MIYNLEPLRPLDQTVIPERVCINFTSRCNMHCEYCYIPFDGKKSKKSMWTAVIDRIVSWGTKAVTIGGGDPMYYRDARALLSYAHDAGLFVHLDTNGLAILSEDLALLKENVHLLGLPIDSADPAIHALMRSHSSHYQVVTRLVTAAYQLGIRTKLNTVVSALNASSIEGISKLVNNYGISRWSLYRFWRIGPAAVANSDKFEVPESLFRGIVQKMRDQCPKAVVECGDIGARHKSYFFVSHTGRAYTVDPNNSASYVDLGSVFSENVLDRWRELADPSLNSSRSKSRTILGE